MSSRSRRNRRRREQRGEAMPPAQHESVAEPASEAAGDVLVLTREEGPDHEVDSAEAASDETGADEPRASEEPGVVRSAEASDAEEDEPAAGRAGDDPHAGDAEGDVARAEREEPSSESAVGERGAGSAERAEGGGDHETRGAGQVAVDQLVATPYPQERGATERKPRGRIRSWERRERIPAPRASEPAAPAEPQSAPAAEHAGPTPAPTRAAGVEDRETRPEEASPKTRSSEPAASEPASARLRVTRAHMGAALRTGALLGIVLAIAWAGLVIGVVSILGSTGALEPLSEAYATLTGEPGASFLTASATREFALVSAGFIWLATLCTTFVLALTYNVIAMCGGGLEVTVRER